MKSVIALLSIIISNQVFAYSATDAMALTSASPLLTSAITTGSSLEKQAILLINDAQEFMQSGKISSFLGQKIKETQERHPDQSPADALESLINHAEEILSK